jgi:DNA-binding IclR family transcriptional regulator
MNRTRYTAPALEKGLDILELLSGSSEPLSMGQIAERLSRSKGEIFRMLVSLERRRYLARDEATDRFQIGSRLFEMAMQSPPTRNLVATAMPHITRVAHVLDQSCHLTILSDTQIVVIARVEAPGELGFAVRLGYRRRVDQSTSGRVLAAFTSAEERARLFDRMADQYPDFDRADFLRRLEEVEEQGFARGPSRAVAGVTDIGAPVRGETGYAVAALTVPFISRDASAVDLNAATEAVLAEAAAISADLAIGMPVSGISNLSGREVDL